MKDKYFYGKATRGLFFKAPASATKGGGLAGGLDWQPIATAPKDGTPFLTYSEDADKAKPRNYLDMPGTPFQIMSWWPMTGEEPHTVNEEGDQHFSSCYSPTHWARLDALPRPPTGDDT